MRVFQSYDERIGQEVFLPDSLLKNEAASKFFSRLLEKILKRLTVNSYLLLAGHKRLLRVHELNLLNRKAIDFAESNRFCGKQ
jgi:hypothetical protein